MNALIKFIEEIINWAEEILNQGNIIIIEKFKSFLLDYIKVFQHERFIHLIVTLFFCILTIAIIILLFIFDQSLSIINMLILLLIIFLVMDMAYIIHYYKLENLIQKLEKDLYKMDMKLLEFYKKDDD